MTGSASQALAEVKRAFDEDVAAEEQMSLLDPVSAEEMLEAREELGENAGTLTLLRHARERRKGRPPGARNKRTDDFARYLGQFGPDPMIGAYRTANTPPEVLIEASRREKTIGFDKHGKAKIIIDEMSYKEALDCIARARELVAPYLHGKKPVAVDVSIRGDITLVEEISDGLGARAAVDGEFLEVGPSPNGGGEGGDA